MEVIPRVSVDKNELPKAENPKSPPYSPFYSQSNAFLGNDWGSLDFSKFFIVEYKARPSGIEFLGIIETKVDDTPAQEEKCDPIQETTPSSTQESNLTPSKDVNVCKPGKEGGSSLVETFDIHWWNETLYVQLPPPEALQTRYGFGYELASQYGYGQKGLGCIEQGIQAPIQFKP